MNVLDHSLTYELTSVFFQPVSIQTSAPKTPLPKPLEVSPPATQVAACHNNVLLLTPSFRHCSSTSVFFMLLIQKHVVKDTPSFKQNFLQSQRARHKNSLAQDDFIVLLCSYSRIKMSCTDASTHKLTHSEGTSAR